MVFFSANRSRITRVASASSRTRRIRRSRPSCSAGSSSRRRASRSEEHTSELQSRFDLVCRLLLEKKKKKEKQSDNTMDRCTCGGVREHGIWFKWDSSQ